MLPAETFQNSTGYLAALILRPTCNGAESRMPRALQSRAQSAPLCRSVVDPAITYEDFREHRIAPGLDHGPAYGRVPTRAMADTQPVWFVLVPSRYLLKAGADFTGSTHQRDCGPTVLMRMCRWPKRKFKRRGHIVLPIGRQQRNLPAFILQVAGKTKTRSRKNIRV